jgi:hypothetical protein
MGRATVIVEHTGATEDYATVLAEMRASLSDEPEVHVDGGTCHFEVAVVWRCEECGREQHHPLTP